MIILVLTVKQSMDLRGVRFHFVDLTAESGILCWNIQFTFCIFCALAIVIQEIHKREMKHSANLL